MWRLRTCQTQSAPKTLNSNPKYQRQPASDACAATPPPPCWTPLANAVTVGAPALLLPYPGVCSFWTSALHTLDSVLHMNSYPLISPGNALTYWDLTVGLGRYAGGLGGWGGVG